MGITPFEVELPQRGETMPSCIFYGPRDCPDSVKTTLWEALVDLIEDHRVDMFHMGNQGQFDAMVRSTLRELKKEYPQIEYAVVLAYMPGKRNEYDDYSDTMLPEGIEPVHPHYAISWRNNWIVKVFRWHYFENIMLMCILIEQNFFRPAIFTFWVISCEYIVH